MMRCGKRNIHHMLSINVLHHFTDTIMLVNEMNKLHHLDKKLQFDFLLNSVRTRKRYVPWMKKKKLKNMSVLKSIMVTVMKRQSLLLKYLMMNR